MNNMDPTIKTTEQSPTFCGVEKGAPSNSPWRSDDDFDNDFLADEKTRKPKGKKIKKMRSTFDR